MSSSDSDSGDSTAEREAEQVKEHFDKVANLRNLLADLYRLSSDVFKKESISLKSCQRMRRWRDDYKAELKKMEEWDIRLASLDQHLADLEKSREDLLELVTDIVERGDNGTPPPTVYAQALAIIVANDKSLEAVRAVDPEVRDFLLSVEMQALQQKVQTQEGQIDTLTRDKTKAESSTRDEKAQRVEVESNLAKKSQDLEDRTRELGSLNKALEELKRDKDKAEKALKEAELSHTNEKSQLTDRITNLRRDLGACEEKIPVLTKERDDAREESRRSDALNDQYKIRVKSLELEEAKVVLLQNEKSGLKKQLESWQATNRELQGNVEKLDEELALQKSLLEDTRSSLKTAQEETIPELQKARDTARSELKVAKEDTIPRLERERDAVQSELKAAKEDTIPALERERNSAQSELKAAKENTIPDLQRERDTAQSELKVAKEDLIPNLQRERDTAQSELKVAKEDTIPKLERERDAAQSTLETTNKQKENIESALERARKEEIPDLQKAKEAAESSLEDIRRTDIPELERQKQSAESSLKELQEKDIPELEKENRELKAKLKEAEDTTIPNLMFAKQEMESSLQKANTETIPALENQSNEARERAEARLTQAIHTMVLGISLDDACVKYITNSMLSPSDTSLIAVPESRALSWGLELRTNETSFSNEALAHVHETNLFGLSVTLWGMIRNDSLNGHRPSYLVAFIATRIMDSNDSLIAKILGLCIQNFANADLKKRAEMAWLAVGMTQLARCLQSRYPEIWNSLEESQGEIHARLKAHVDAVGGIISIFNSLVSRGNNLSAEALMATFQEKALESGSFILLSDKDWPWVLQLQPLKEGENGIPYACLIAKKLFSRRRDEDLILDTVTYEVVGPQSFDDLSFTCERFGSDVRWWWRYIVPQLSIPDDVQDVLRRIREGESLPID